MVAVVSKTKMSTEVEELLSKAKGSLFRRGDAEAQYNLGRCFENGLGVAMDKSQAVEWYRKAALRGDANAQYSLGWMLEAGLGGSCQGPATSVGVVPQGRRTRGCFSPI